MSRIKMKNPIVEIDGDEFARIIWNWVKDILIMPHVDLKTEYYDLHIKNRDNTNDQVTIDAADAIKKHGVGVKCATITANLDRQKEYNLKDIYKSPNATIRKILGGTSFRKPIILETIKSTVPNWKKPIIVARHTFGDLYASLSMEIEAGTKVEIVLRDEQNRESRTPFAHFEEDGILLCQYNLENSIYNFAESCFKYAMEEKLDLLFSAKDTVTKAYDTKFKSIFEELYETKYREMFAELGIKYQYSLIDNAIAKILRSEGGIVWACKNYEGDLMSDMVAAGFSSLGLMTSVLISPEGMYEFEAAHGTIQDLYYKHLKGEKTSANPTATIFAWTGALRKRGALDGNDDLVMFAKRLEDTTLLTLNSGFITEDIFNISTASNKRICTSEEIIDIIASNLEKSYK
ncbi:MAG: NADP-dependent isocitrate dehydrogenase [Tepidanaerobacteraceae bacterium]|jgi:isocitrate dehydrogenase|nr:NADP-dependent isocitrate dehydrogenase [Tepidanaerobacter sp.]HQA60534.1 NADP-dependent isocitrate dehydrogenase [Tepidanaerobacteraceae bacterium]HQE05770.1 NADP-dependent isocitrate dehydrogenase [Tepidanaerobacteraceae bacterium]